MLKILMVLVLIFAAGCVAQDASSTSRQELLQADLAIAANEALDSEMSRMIDVPEDLRLRPTTNFCTGLVCNPSNPGECGMACCEDNGIVACCCHWVGGSDGSAVCTCGPSQQPLPPPRPPEVPTEEPLAPGPEISAGVSVPPLASEAPL